MDKHNRSFVLVAAARRNTDVCFPVTIAVMLSTGIFLFGAKKLDRWGTTPLSLTIFCFSPESVEAGFLHMI